jgi:hypothetical protein
MPALFGLTLAGVVIQRMVADADSKHSVNQHDGPAHA